MSAASYLRQKLLDDLTGVTPYVRPTLYLSLHTADPGDAGSHAFEVAGGGYARLSLAGKMGAADSEGYSVNTVALSIGPATTDWGTITYLAIEDAAVAGNMLWPGAPSQPRTITSGQTFQIPVGQLRLKMT
jgi:hypothetical protein